ncbi:MAG: aspartate-semialdehyde dehydrogenase [Gammaproteobacteria bacterium]
MTKKVNVAVVGATGAVGAQMMEILAERNFPVKDLFALASSRSAGDVLHYGKNKRETTVLPLDSFDFSRADIALFSAGGAISGQYAPIAAKAGCIVVDNSSKFRADADVPLVVSEVNAHALAGYGARNIIANPNCSTMQMLVAVKPVYDAAGIRRINAATYQAASGAGRRALEDLAKQSAALLSGADVGESVFPARLAFNVVPHIDVFEENGYTREEMKMAVETQKILGDDSVLVNATAVRVPVFYGHAIAAHLETAQKISAGEVRKLLQDAPGVCVMDECQAGGYPTPSIDAAGKDEVFVGRIREDITHERGINLWIVSDNTRKGAALNAVQIAELLVAGYLGGGG